MASILRARVGGLPTAVAAGVRSRYQTRELAMPIGSVRPWAVAAACARVRGARSSGAVERSRADHRRPLPPERHEHRRASAVLGRHARRQSRQDRHRRRHRVSRRLPVAARASAERADARHDVRPHRLRGARRAGADDQGRRERLRADGRARAGAGRNGEPADGRQLRPLLVPRRPRRRQGRARHEHAAPTRRRSRTTTCTS